MGRWWRNRNRWSGGGRLISFLRRWRDIGVGCFRRLRPGGMMFMFGSFWRVLLLERIWNNSMFWFKSVGVSPFFFFLVCFFDGVVGRGFWLMLLRRRDCRPRLQRAKLIIQICF